MGERGEEGEQGPRGEPGKTLGADAGPAEQYMPRLRLSSNATLDLISVADGIPGEDGIRETLLVYSLTGYRGGDVQTHCRAESGAESASGGDYYPSGTVGAGEGWCIAMTDLPPIGGVGSNVGLWRFTVGDTGPRVAYVDDPSHPLEGLEIDFVEDDCSVQRSDAVGEWESLTLTELFD
jgi:hypothetical protein